MKKNLLIILVFLSLTSILYTASYRGELIAKDRYVTIDFKDMDLLDVVRVIARKFNLNLIAGDQVKGKVTVSFKNVTVDEALETILKINNYTYIKTGDIIRVVPFSEAEKYYEKIEEYDKIEKKEQKFTVIKLKYANVNDVKPLIQMLLSKNEKVMIDEASNKILIFTNEGNTIVEEKIKNIMSEVDIETVDNIIEPFEIEVIRIKHKEIEDIVSIITDININFKGKIKGNKALKSIIINASKKEMEKIKKIIRRFDTPPLQVTIEAKIIEISDSNDKERGLTIKANAPNGEKVYTNDALTTYDIGNDIVAKTTSEIYNGISSNGLDITFGMLSKDNFQIYYRSLLTQSKANLLSSPVITTVNGKAASINIVNQIPYKEAQTEDSNGNSVEGGYEFKDAGIKLEVIPFIGEDGIIKMEVKPEVSDVTEYTSDGVPIISTRNASTNIIIKDGQTLAIGGLMKTDEIEQITTVPILGEIPLLGRLFRNKKIIKEKTNLMIFITPNIIKTREFSNEFNMSNIENEEEKEINWKNISLESQKKMFSLYLEFGDNEKVKLEIEKLIEEGVKDKELDVLYKKALGGK